MVRSTSNFGHKLRQIKLQVELPTKRAKKVSDMLSTKFTNANPMDAVANDGAIPFNTQFFHDDYDDGPGFDDMYDADGNGMGGPEPDAGEQDLLAATQGHTRRVRPEFVNYAKRAKRVDVKKLKENIWKCLDITVDQVDMVSLTTMSMPLPLS